MATEAPYFLFNFLDNREWLINTCGPCSLERPVHQSSGFSFLICKTKKLGLMTFPIYFPVAEFCEAIKCLDIMILISFGYFPTIMKYFSLSRNVHIPFVHCYCLLYITVYFNFMYLQSTDK